MWLPKKRSNPERVFQFSVKRFLNVALPLDAFWTHFPAGGGGKARGAILKDMGLKPGVPDILIWWARRSYALELKASKGSLSAEQKAAIAALDRAGCLTAVCKTLDDVQDALNDWEIPLRAVLDPRTVTGARMVS